MGAQVDFAFSCGPTGRRSSHSQTALQTSSSFHLIYLMPFWFGPWKHPHCRSTRVPRPLILAGSNGQSGYTCSYKRWFHSEPNGGGK